MYIAGNARSVKKEDAAFENVFKLPHGWDFSYQKTVEVAESFRDNLTGATLDKFVEFGINANIAALLQTGIDDYNAAVSEQGSGKSGGVAATAQTRATMTRLKNNRRTLKQIGINIYFGDPVKTAAWKSACHVKKPDAPPAPAPPQP